MKNPICATAYEWELEWIKAGRPIDHRKTLPHWSFRVEQLPGYADSRVYKLGPLDTGWVIPLRFRTDRQSGTVISDFNFETPWQNHVFDWDYEPEEIIPKKDQVAYKHLFKSRLTGVLKEGRLIRRGSPVDGVLCGRSYQPIGESSHGFISAKLSFRDDRGNTVQLGLSLNVDTHSYSSASRLLSGKAGQPVSRLHDWLTELATTSDSGRESAGPLDFAGFSPGESETIPLEGGLREPRNASTVMK